MACLCVIWLPCNLSANKVRVRTIQTKVTDASLCNDTCKTHTMYKGTPACTFLRLKCWTWLIKSLKNYKMIYHVLTRHTSIQSASYVSPKKNSTVTAPFVLCCHPQPTVHSRWGNRYRAQTIQRCLFKILKL